MRFYKIINIGKTKRATEFLTEIGRVEKANQKKARDITPFEWKYFLTPGSSIYLVTQYLGFQPKERIEAPKGWKYDKKNPTILVCDKKTKKGRKNAKFLSSLPNYMYDEIYKILDIEEEIFMRFTLPSLVLSKDKKEIFLIIDRKYDLPSIDYKEVTKNHVDKMLK